MNGQPPNRDRRLIIVIIVMVATTAVAGLGLGAWGLYAGFRAVSGLFGQLTAISEPVDEFLAAAQAGDSERAYRQVSARFREATPPERIKAFLAARGLDAARQPSWTRRSIANDLATLQGTIPSRTGKTLPINVRLVWEGGAWKIDAITVAPAGLSL